MAEFAVGSTFADHVIRGVAGRGGMGVVYRAMHLPLKREVALKVIAPDVSTNREFRERFRQEFLAAASIQHPNVIPIYHAGEEAGLLYVTMRYVQGTDLARLLALEERLEPLRAATFVAEIGGALDAAHRLGIVHRDVKPGNVLIEGEDADAHALLTDFGLTKSMNSDAQLTRAGGFVGTLDYAAPEQLKGTRVDARTDVYALGCLLYHAVSGRVPFPAASDAAKMFAHIESQATPASVLADHVPPGLDEVLSRAMAKDPDERFASAGDLGRAALAVLGGASLVTGPGVSVAFGSAAADAEPAHSNGGHLAPLVVPLPPALAGELSRGSFVGRRPELDRMREHFTLAEQGQRQFVLLSGEPGIGKTRLAAELAREAHERGATVLHGRSDAESLVPYQPFITAVQHRVAHRRQLGFPPELEPELDELGRFIPALRQQITLRERISEEPEARRYRLFEAVTHLLGFVAQDRPVVLVLDDLQWADTSTALLLGHLLQDIESVKLLIVGTYREGSDTRSDELAELLTRLRRQPGFERIALGGLDAADTEAFFAAVDGRDVSDTFVQRLREETDGNPFFLEETLRSLAEVSADDDPDALPDDALSQIAVPEGVKDMIGRRLARLPETATQVLGVASVVGREFRLEVLEALIDEPADRIITALEEADEAGLVREVEEDVDCFVFAHALVRETLYDQFSASRRVRLHHRIAVALEELGPRVRTSPAELAYHYFESRHLDREGKAIDYAVEAAAQAGAALAYEEAAGHYRRALGALEALRTPDRGRECEVLLGLGNVQSRAGDPAARETFARAVELARREGSPEQLARAALGRAARYGEAGVVDNEGIAGLEEALEGLEGESVLKVRVLARLADSLHFAAEMERTIALSAAALEMAQRLDDGEALVAALQSRHLALLSIEHLDERLRLSETLLALSARVRERELKALAHHWRIYDLLEAGDVAAARAEHAALAQLAEELRQPLYRHFAARWEVVWAQLAGRVTDAERLARAAYELGKLAQARDADTIYAAQLLTLRRRQARFNEQVTTVESFVQRHPRFVAWRSVLPLVQLSAGEVESARAEFEFFAADDFKVVPRDMLWFTAICLLSEACALLGDVPRARVLYELVLPYRSRFVQVTQAASFGSAERFLGLLAGSLGEHDAAVEHLGAALAANEAQGMLPLGPFVRREFAEALLARGAAGDAEQAGGLLRETLEVAEAAGLEPLAARARELLATMPPHRPEGDASGSSTRGAEGAAAG